MILVIVLLLLSVAFLTLSERKFLSYSQLRLGPNKNLVNGLIQPILDGFKLLKKSNTMSLKIHNLIFTIVSLLIMILSVIMFILIPFISWSNKILVPLFIMMMFGISSYMILILGWTSMNNYSLMGGNRSLAQSLSFEMIFTLLILILFVMKYKMSLNFKDYKSVEFFCFIEIVYIISMIVECHRAPMDLSEGESELISGYNVEFYSFFFVMVFLSEYMLLLFMLMLMLFLWAKMYMFLLIMMIIIIIRSCFPRIRYDQVMMMIWLKVLPFLLLLWFFYMNF